MTPSGTTYPTSQTFQTAPLKTNRFYGFLKETGLWTLHVTPRTVISYLGGNYCLGYVYVHWYEQTFLTIQKLAIQYIIFPLYGPMNGYVIVGMAMPYIHFYTAVGIRIVCGIVIWKLCDLVQKIIVIFYDKFFSGKPQEIPNFA